MAVTGTFGQTFYQDAQAELATVVELAEKVDAHFLARTAVYARDQLLAGNRVAVSFEGVDRVSYFDAEGIEDRLPVAPGFRGLDINSGLEALAAGPDGTLYTLPERRTWPWEYAAVFSPVDVIEEYLPRKLADVKAFLP